MSNTLLPCPFCGGEALMVKTQKCGRYVMCADCESRTAENETDYAGNAYDKATAAWNRRTGKDINVTTNADRIRSMTDEELAQFLGDEPPYFATYKQYIDWLRKPIESEVEHDGQT